MLSILNSLYTYINDVRWPNQLQLRQNPPVTGQDTSLDLLQDWMLLSNLWHHDQIWEGSEKSDINWITVLTTATVIMRVPDETQSAMHCDSPKIVSWSLNP